jgi:hypothetical protein
LNKKRVNTRGYHPNTPLSKGFPTSLNKALHYCLRSQKGFYKTMDKQSLINELCQYLQTEKSCAEALLCLKPNAEIEIIVGSTHISVRPNEDQVQVNVAKAQAPDFVFTATPSAIEVLITEKGLSPTQLAIKLIKEILANEVKVAMPISLLMVPRKGYLNLIKLGGLELFNELRKYNIHSIPQILDALRRLKKG